LAAPSPLDSVFFVAPSPLDSVFAAVPSPPDSVFFAAASPLEAGLALDSDFEAALRESVT
jgi:hypothetical protein